MCRKRRAGACRRALRPARRCTGEIYRSPAKPGRDKPIASASTSSGKSPKTGTRDHKDRTEFRSPCGPWRKYIFAKTRARDARVRPRVNVDRDAFRQKQKNPFQEKVIISISRGKSGLQSRKAFPPTKNGAPGGCTLPTLRTGVPPFRQAGFRNFRN